MIVFERIIDLKSCLGKERQKGHSVGFVPTMGALHEGHVSLVKKAHSENDLVVCSVFVNPTQFNNPEDLKKYPRNIEKDLDILRKNNCDIVFTPKVNEMYPVPATEEYYFGDIEEVMEGKYRKGHFNGVAVVVKKFFDIVEPDRAYFGMKDYQQLSIVKKLVQMKNIPVDIIPCATMREADGLAMSSRNKLLSQNQRKDASVIYKTLLKARKHFEEMTVKELKEFVKTHINSTPSFELEYFEIVDSESLKSIECTDCIRKAIACIAVYAGNVRLIDNMFFND